MKRLGRVLSLTLGLGVAVVLLEHFHYSVKAPERIYADPGSSITAFVESTTSGAPQVTWTISGTSSARTTKHFAEKAMRPEVH